MSEPAIYLSAGEPSGDRLAAGLAPALARAFPGVPLEGMGGPRMRAAGVRILHPSDDLAAVGLAEAAAALPRHVGLLRAVRRRLREHPYLVAIFVDYPGFHLAAARAARAAGIPVLHYVAPQLWAWGAWRARRLRAAVDRLAVILPFEEPFFRGRGIAARFVGHPLLEEPPLPRQAARAALGIPDDTPVLALLPGSRAAEVRRLWPPVRDAARQLCREIPALTVVVATLPALKYPGAEPFRQSVAPTATVLAAADAALCKSGTGSLEAALAGTPHVVAYRLHAATWAVARRLVRVRWVSLVNLIAEEGAVPELLQNAATPEALAAAVRPLLVGNESASHQQAVFTKVRERLGPPGAAARVAHLARELVA